MSAALAGEGHGALRIDATKSTVQKCTMVGVPKARVASALPRFIWAPSVITTNWRPVNVAAAVPMMTKKAPQPKNNDTPPSPIIDLLLFFTTVPTIRWGLL